MSIPATGLAAPSGTTGSGSPIRESREFAQVMTQQSGKLFESASRGQVFAGMSVTGRNPQTAMAVTVPILLYNPLGSNKRFELLRVGCSNAATGTFSSGAIFHALFTLNGPVATQAGTVPAAGTAITPTCLDVGSPNSSVASCISNGTLAAAPTASYPAFQVGDSVGGTTTNPIAPLFEDIDGMIVLEPGAGWCLCGVTATTAGTPLILCGVLWREAPLS